MTKSWWENQLRAVTLEFPAADIPTIDVASIVDECNAGGVNTLVVFAVGYYPGGATFYQSAIAPHYPTLGGRDLLLEAITHAHKNGQKALAFVSAIWGDSALYNAHPDWAQKKRDGSLNSWDEENNTVAMCPNSGYAEYLSSVVLEIANNYDVDGFYFDEASFQSWCACENCQRAFLKETGLKIPLEDNFENPEFIEFLRWRERKITDWRQSLYALCKTPTRCVVFQGAFTLSMLPPVEEHVFGYTTSNHYVSRFSSVNWYAPTAHGFSPHADAQYADVLHMELYRRMARLPLWWYSLALKYANALAPKKQKLVLHMLNQSPFDACGLPEDEVRVSFGELMANGGSSLIARYYPDQADESSWAVAYDCLKQMQRMEPYLNGRQTIKYAALLVSQTSLLMQGPNDGPRHLDCAFGFAKALLQQHIPFDIVTERELEAGLEDYALLIIPNAVFLPNESVSALYRLQNGGLNIVASHQSGRFDENGKLYPERMDELLGLHLEKSEPEFRGTDVYMKQMPNIPFANCPPEKRILPAGVLLAPVKTVEAISIYKELGASEVHYGPLSKNTGAPAIAALDKNGARAVYFAMPAGAFYLEYGVKEYSTLICEAVLWAAQKAPPITAKLPKTVALTAYTQGKSRMILHMNESLFCDWQQPIDGLQPIHNASLNLQAAKKATRVFAPEVGEIDFTQQKETLHIHLPEFTGHLMAVVDFE
ncbi:family 10 glycosylhydrolase [Eubacteriales bacterium OttesenSCG-928-K08]|nr:family 10 glycosylhydrolase [Eubacteriales bacterium OttesenSCG-928-K08]